MENIFIQVTPEDVLCRMDLFLSQKFSSFSRSYFSSLLEKSLVTLNGKIAKKREIPSVGDSIQFTHALSLPEKAEGEDIPLDILYEDEDLLVINKPQNFVVHPAPGHPNHTLMNALIHRYHQLKDQEKMRYGIVHRLDKDTSGVMLIAKNSRCHELLSRAFKERLIKKTYVALCLGNPKDTKVHNELGRCPTNRKKFTVVEGGKEAISEIKVLSFKHGYSLVQITPHTGRTHQIRVHLSHLGCPIVGDPLYGSSKINKELGCAGQSLHAQSIELLHPITGSPLYFEASIPIEFRNLKKNLHKEF